MLDSVADIPTHSLAENAEEGTKKKSKKKKDKILKGVGPELYTPCILSSRISLKVQRASLRSLQFLCVGFRCVGGSDVCGCLPPMPTTAAHRCHSLDPHSSLVGNLPVLQRHRRAGSKAKGCVSRPATTVC